LRHRWMRSTLPNRAPPYAADGASEAEVEETQHPSIAFKRSWFCKDLSDSRGVETPRRLRAPRLPVFPTQTAKPATRIFMLFFFVRRHARGCVRAGAQSSMRWGNMWGDPACSTVLFISGARSARNLELRSLFLRAIPEHTHPVQCYRTYVPIKLCRSLPGFRRFMNRALSVLASPPPVSTSRRLC